jgi:hypothetical protein
MKLTNVVLSKRYMFKRLKNRVHGGGIASNLLLITVLERNRPRNPIYRGRGIGARVHAWKPGYSPIPTANASGDYA